MGAESVATSGSLWEHQLERKLGEHITYILQQGKSEGEQYGFRPYSTPPTPAWKPTSSTIILIISEMAFHTCDEIQAFKEAFDAFDWNKSGTISYKSLQVKDHYDDM